jgi:Cation transporting ATPase, C-terminus
MGAPRSICTAERADTGLTAPWKPVENVKHRWRCLRDQRPPEEARGSPAKPLRDPRESGEFGIAGFPDERRDGDSRRGHQQKDARHSEGQIEEIARSSRTGRSPTAARPATLQILWINLVTDGLPALALAVEPPERDVMRRTPRPQSESLLGDGMVWHIAGLGLLIGGVTLALGLWIWHNQNPAWQSMVFTTLALLQMGHVLAIRIDRASVLGRGFFGNRAELGSVLVLIGLQLAALYVPVLQSVFVTVPLSFAELGVCVVASTSVFWAVEAEKWVRRRKTGAAAG